MTMPAEETVERVWPKTAVVCSACGEGLGMNRELTACSHLPPADEIEVVPRALLDEALEAMEKAEDELTNGATANWHYIKQQFDKARSIRASLDRSAE